MDADEERNFAALLSRSTALPARPTWSPPTSSSSTQPLDPWANPFASSPTDPFTAPATTTPYSAAPATDQSYLPPAAASYDDYNYDNNTNGFDYNPPAPVDEHPTASSYPADEIAADSPYVQKLESEQIIPPSAHSGIPEPPSVIAARERDQLSWGDESGGFGGESGGFGGAMNGSTYTPTADSYAQPFGTSPPNQPSWDANSNDTFVQLRPVIPPIPTPKSAPKPKAGGRVLPADLIDEDLMAASDPSISLKRAFVKSAPTPAKGKGKSPEKAKRGAYVFRPAGKSSPVRHKAEESKEVKVEPKANAGGETGEGQKPTTRDIAVTKTEERAVKEAETVEELNEKTEGKVEECIGIEDGDQGKCSDLAPSSADTQDEAPNTNGEVVERKEPGITLPKVDKDEPPKQDEAASATDVSTPAPPTEISPPYQPPADSPTPTPTPLPPIAPSSIPLPASLAPTRTSTPLPPTHPSSPSPTLYPAQTPTHDRVAVSPLEPPTAQIGEGGDFGFKALSIGGAALNPPVSGGDEGWGGSGSGSAPGTGNRFGGKGWGAMDSAVDEGDEGLFGRGGPVGDPWGGGGAGSWGGEERAVAGPSSPITIATPFAENEPEPEPRSFSPSTPTPSIQTSTSPKTRRKPQQVFSISISDPARVGDPVRGYTVYTIRTHTTSPHYRKSDFTALRRFSDFLWLFDSLIANNPGIIVPPVPDKHTFGRFQEQFIETRRLALERSLNKIASHPVLQLDPDLRLFLESDNFAAEIKGRRPESLPDLPVPKSGGGLLGGWNAPKFTETDDWFTSRTAFLDGLENQLKALSKSIDLASRTRLDMASAHLEVADSLQALAESDLGSAMCASLANLADLARREKEAAEELAKGDVVNLLNMADEYVRFVGSVRRAMGGRVRVWLAWQAQEKEVGRLKSAREKARVQGKLGDRAAQTLAEINEVDRRSRSLQQEYDTLTKLVKSEFGRFERERVDEFKRVLEKYLDDQVDRQREMIMAWEEYHVGVMGMVKKAQGVRGEGGARA